MTTDRGPDPHGYPPPAYAPPPSAETNTRAVVSLVLGVCGIIILPLILSIPAIIVGRRARREIDASGGGQTGRSMATAGIVLGWIGVVVVAAVVLVGLAVVVVAV